MNSFVATLANGTVQIWEAAALMAVAAVRMPPPRKKRRAEQLDNRTLKDIGLPRKKWRAFLIDFPNQGSTHGQVEDRQGARD